MMMENENVDVMRMQYRPLTADEQA